MAMAELAAARARLLPVGQLLTIHALDSASPDEPEGPGYASRVEDHEGDTVVVSMPMRQRQLVPLPPGTRVSAYYNRDGSRYRFRAEVGSLEDSPVPVLRLVRVQGPIRHERRAQARVAISLEPVRVMACDSEGWIELNPRFTPAINISAGGVALVCRRPLEPGRTVRLVLDLPGDFGRIDLSGEVARCAELASEQARKWVVGIVFRGLTVKDRDRLSAFVLCQQQSLRRRGLL